MAIRSVVLVGFNSGGRIGNSHASGDVEGINNVGGLVGRSPQRMDL